MFRMESIVPSARMPLSEGIFRCICFLWRSRWTVLGVGNGGESGIRTHVRVSPKHAFQACAFNHSAISPEGGVVYFNLPQWLPSELSGTPPERSTTPDLKPLT